MHVIVIGAGLLGVSTAYFLRQHGVDVTVVDGEPGPALGASYGNGGYVQSSLPDPWNAPGAFKLFTQAWLNSLTGKGDRSAFAARTAALPGLASWGLKFLNSANQTTFLDHTIKNLHLAQYTRRVLDDINANEALSYCWSDRGGLMVFRSDESLAAYVNIAEYVGRHAGEHGARFEVLDRDALLSKEPSLTDIGDELVGAVYFSDDSAGNAREFCQQLAAISADRGVEFSYDAIVKSITTTANGVVVSAGQDEIAADAVIIAAGTGSKRLARPLGIKLPIAPAKGYSISIPMGDWSNRPSHVVCDMAGHSGINPMGEILRVAGTAEFAGMKPGITTARTDYLIGLVKQVFPKFAKTIDRTKIDPWAGHRPLSADGIPMIGPTLVDNVYVNTGHGGLGWTQAAGSAKALADQIAGVKPEIDLGDYSVARFGSARSAR